MYHIVGDGDWLWAQLIHTQEFGVVNNDMIVDKDDIVSNQKGSVCI